MEASGRTEGESMDAFVVDVGQGRLFHALGSPVERLIHPKTVGSDQLGVSIVTLAPGGEVIRHRHDYEEAYFVVSGVGRMYLDGVGEFDLSPGRAVYIPSGRIHGQVNSSTDEDLSILCALSPPPVEG